jgi:hypothetical protein
MKRPERQSKMSETLELVLNELQNRIGQITSNYETQMAVLKAQVTQEIETRDKRIAELENEINAVMPDVEGAPEQ